MIDVRARPHSLARPVERRRIERTMRRAAGLCGHFLGGLERVALETPHVSMA